MRARARACIALFTVVGWVLVACVREGSTDAAISVDAGVAAADRPVHIKVSGLEAREKITVTATALDKRNRRWRSYATFRADSRGTVDLDQARPISGSYTGVDGMGLFWSMNPPSGNPEQSGFLPRPPPESPAYRVQIEVSGHGHRLARQTLTRQWITAGVTHQTLGTAAGTVSGVVFRPSPDGHRHPAVVLIGGSEGGNSGLYDAALLASHGFAALALAYFGDPGLPATLNDIPLEYFARAARLLAAQPGVDPAHLVVRGGSRGSEAALLLAQNYPDLIHGVILYAPSAVANIGFPHGGTAWTNHSHAIRPYSRIPVDHVNGPVLAITGALDELQDPSNTYLIVNKLNLDRRFTHQALTYPAAGHGVGTFPYLSFGTQLRHPVTGKVLRFGGSRAGNAAAQEQGWPKALAFLANLH